MRRVVAQFSVSLDGFFEGVDRDISWHRVDDELHQHFNDELRTMGGFLSGRVTWELMAAYWPHADEDPASPAAVREFAGIWRDMPKIVFSRTLAQAGWNTTIRREVDPAEIRGLLAEPGGDLAVGGAELAAAFHAHDLVDEWRLYVNPVILGRGRGRPFAEIDGVTDLQLLESRTFGNGVVGLRYGRANSELSSS